MAQYQVVQTLPRHWDLENCRRCYAKFNYHGFYPLQIPLLLYWSNSAATIKYVRSFKDCKPYQYISLYVAWIGFIEKYLKLSIESCSFLNEMEKFRK